MQANKSFTITKKIAKHGSQAVILVPTLLQEKLKPGTLAEIRIEVIEEALQIINKDAQISIFKDLLKYYPLVLVKEKGKFVGIITKSDVIGNLS